MGKTDWKLEGRAVDDVGNGSTWEWRDVPGLRNQQGTLPDRTERVMLEALMRDDFAEVFGHPPTRVEVVWLPSCGVDSLYKLPTWRQALDAMPDEDQGRRGLWVTHCEFPDCEEHAERQIGRTAFCAAHAWEAGMALIFGSR